jgi:hypothetical protein
MKKLRAAIDQWLEGLDKNWEAMPVKKQHRVILYFFAAYVTLTTISILNVCRGKADAGNNPAAQHIQNPAGFEKGNPKQQDSLKRISKKQDYERN